MKDKLSLSDSEYEIMELLWKEGRPLSKAEIVELSTDKNWKESSVYIFLNSLLKKGAISEEGYTKSKTNIGRTFVPTMSEEDYTVAQINLRLKKRNLSIPNLLLGLINNDSDRSTIEELEGIIQKKLDELR